MMPAIHFADADSELCDLCRQLFVRHGWQVEVATDGLRSLAQLRAAQGASLLPRLIMLDFQLTWGRRQRACRDA
jgi:DNA-binding response OmpR family regulator